MKLQAKNWSRRLTMTRSRYTRILTYLLLCALTLTLVGAGPSYGQKQPNLEPAPLQPRPIFPKPAKTVVNDPEEAKVVVLKFHEGTRVRLRDGQLKAELELLSAQERELLKRNQLTEEQTKQELAAVSKLLSQYDVAFNRAFERKEEELEQEKLEGELNTGEELADLNLYYHLFPVQAQPELTAQLVNQLNALGIVEIAYPLPPARPAQMDITPVTSSFVASQGYLNVANTLDPSSNGIDARYAWTRTGGRGDGVRVIDIEGGWNLTHEDLRPVFYQNGENDSQFDWKNHGTAVLGEIAGAENGYGVTGIAPNAEIGVVSHFRRFLFVVYPDAAGAISNATEQLRAGDILLIELHRRGPRSGRPVPADDDQFEFIAIEYWQADFDAIRAATARGIIVVEAAGNGSMNLDEAQYERRFDRRFRDSGAIVVGAGSSFDRSPHAWSNAGNRVDVQGWGDSVMTLGYGDIMISGSDENQWYTPGFSGTSSASPIVVGAAAALQGIRKAAGLPVLNSVQMRDLLNVTGTLQPAGTRQIGPLPNIRAAISRMGLGSVRPTAQRLVLVRESDRDVDTTLDVQPGDRVVFEAAGSIWSGEYFEGAYGIYFPAPNNGPAGWRSSIARSYAFPLRGVAPYALLAKLDATDYFAVGRSYEYRHVGAAQRLYLRINDDNPGNGSGEFLGYIRIYR